MDSSIVPQVAIITRTKNRPLLLRRAIENVLAQNLADFIHVIVNDGGAVDEVNQLLDEYRVEYRDRLKVLHNAKSMGMQDASNLGIQASQSEFIVIHDDDDSWHESFLSECVSALESFGPDSSYQGVATQSIRVNEKITSDGVVVEVNREDYYPFEIVSLYRIASDNLFPPIAFLYRRAVHDKIGYFNNKFTVLGDWDFNLRFLCHYDIATLKASLAYYHWRVPVELSAYNNSVTAELDEHREKLVVMQNHYLREDINAGRSGLGHLLCSSKMLHGLCHLAWQNQHFAADIQRAAWDTHRLTIDIHKKVHEKSLLSHAIDGWDHFEQMLRRKPKLAKQQVVAGTPSNPIDIRDKIKDAKVLSLDVFDTVLLRAVHKPTDVFMVMEPRARAILGEKNLPFAHLRKQAELAARRQALKKYDCEEVNLDQIYESFDRHDKWGPKLIEKVIALELETERSLLYANPALYDLYAYARELNLPIVYVSDMYLPSAIIRELLIKNGFEVDKLWVSNEHGVSKHHGGLYEIMIKMLGVPPEQILHLGDNYHSDYLKAVQFGIKAVHVEHLRPRALSDQILDKVDYGEYDLASRFSAGLARRFASHPRPQVPENTVVKDALFWKTLGYEVAGPIYFLFFHWLIIKSKHAQINRLFFFSRDGYNLIETFKLLNKRWKIDIDVEYLYASRRLYNLARIVRLDDQALDFILSPNPGLRVRDFLDRCGIPAEEHAARLHSLGLPQLDTVITSSEGQFNAPKYLDQLKQFFISIEESLLERCREERERLYQYLDDKAFSMEGTAVVDVGWRASLCHSLQDLMRQRGKKGRLQAFLFGTWKYARSAMDADCQLDSFFFHLDNPLARKELISECVEIVELLFSAPHPSIVGLKGKEGVFEPIYGEHEHDAVQLAQLAEMRDSALQFVADAAELVDDPEAMRPSSTYVEAILNRVLRHPTIEEAKILGKFQHRAGFGDKGAMRYLANPQPDGQGALSRSNLKYAYDHCYWKAGFRAQLTETQKQWIDVQ